MYNRIRNSTPANFTMHPKRTKPPGIEPGYSNNSQNSGNLIKHFILSVSKNPTQSQLKTLSAIDMFLHSDKNCFLLKGYAGTGKTTLVNGLTQYLLTRKKHFRLMAPTGRAAKIIKEKTRWNAYTIHKSIYSMSNLNEYTVIEEDGSVTFKYFYGLRNNDDPSNTIYIVDEASMVSNQYSEGEFIRFGSGFLLNDLFTYIDLSNSGLSRKIIFIGDSAQLPPVNMNFSPALEKEYLGKLSISLDETEMVDVVRHQENSGILFNATVLRDQIAQKSFNKIKFKTRYIDIIPINHGEVVNKYFDCLAVGKKDKPIIIAYTNKSVQHYNNMIRNHIFPGKNEIQPGDDFIVVRNNYKHSVLNGDFGKVEKILSDTEEISIPLKIKKGTDIVKLRFKNITAKVKDMNGNNILFNCKIIETILDSKDADLTSREQRALYVFFRMRAKELGIKPKTPEFKEAIKTDPYCNALLIKYGYAITCHKAQGGEWKNCIIDFFSTQSTFSENYFRWCYTALTRCKEKLFCLNEPQIGLTDRLKPVQAITAPNISKRIETGIPEHLTFNNNFQIILFKEIISNIDFDVSVISISHNNYSERYIFDTSPVATIIDFYYNKKMLITNLRVIRSGTDSEHLIKKCNEILSTDMRHESGSTLMFPDGKPYLEEFYKEITTKLDGTDIEINNIVHNEFHEQYFFTQGNESALILFYYKESGRFSKIYPDMKKSNSPKLIQNILNLLK